ncbi:MAG TPA: archease [Candidatus Dormibacteraeota bacterium]|nr:archease [Candidatus Dormibacteraeota bacterium]
MPFAWLEDAVTSDVTFRAWGATLDALFAAAVDATTAAMVADLDTVRAVERRSLVIEAEALDLLLLRLLDEVIFLKDTASLLLRAERVEVDAAAAPPRVSATLAGEPIDRARHALVADVKAVTWYDLRVEHVGDEWRAQVTLDV